MTKRTENTGTLSRNRKKEKPTHPDHRGSCVILGQKFWISAYINDSRDEGGGKYFKLYFTAADESTAPTAPTAPPAASPAEPHPADLSSQPDIPF